jgi:peptide/nickel transport system substrate-binding protein
LTDRLRAQIEGVRAGTLPRRAFVQRLAACGLSAPMAGMLLMNAGIAPAQPAAAPYPPTKRGGGGALKLLYWQGPTLLNAHFATGQKDQEGARLFYEPLAAWREDGVLVPILLAELPTRDNGGVAADGRSVTFKLKAGVKWHDGKPFTADDVVFNHAFATDPATAAISIAYYPPKTRVEKLDTLTVRFVFDRPTPFWAGQYVTLSMIPRHLFEPYRGAKSREAPANLAPVGTGPYRFVDFKPGDLVRGALNPDYHLPNRPHFDTVEIKGGGDAVSAARAVLQTGEFDFAWNLQVEDELLKRLEAGGKGRVTMQPGGFIEHIHLNFCDPGVEIKGERSHPDSRHPIFSDPQVRQAMNLLMDRQGLQDVIYGRTGKATALIVNEPAPFRSASVKAEFSIEKASALLDAAGWKMGRDGVREKGGKKLKLLFQSSINAPRQKTQAIVKQTAAKAGIAIEVKAVTASVFFSSDVGSPDTFGKFNADMQMYGNSLGQPDPEAFLHQYTSGEVCSKANKWQGQNIGRWRHPEFDGLFAAAASELDAVKRAALCIRMNDLICNDHYALPLVARQVVTGVSRTLAGPISGWGLQVDFIHDWYRTAA